MATRTTTRRGRAHSKSRRRRPASKASRAPARSRASRSPSIWARGRAAVGHQLAGYAGEALAIALLVLGVLTALGLWSDLAGAVGHGLASAAGALFGLARYAVPFVLLGIAVVCFRAAPRRHTLARVAPDVDVEDGIAVVADGAVEPAPVRVIIGTALLGLATVGVLHLASDSPSIDGGLDKLRAAGGVIGAAIGEPLRWAAGTVGAAVILAGLALLGALLAPGVPMRKVFSGLMTGVRATRRGARALFDVHPLPNAGEAGTAEATPSATLYDVEADSEAFSWQPEIEADDEPTPAPSSSMPAPEPAIIDAGPGEQMAIDLGPSLHGGERPPAWKLPPPTLLRRGDTKTVERRFVEEGGRILQAALHQHGVDARLVRMTVGPTVTRYELELAPGVKVNRVTSLSHDIAYAMASPDVRILAPIPGRSAIGVEVPNRQRQLVTLGDILATPEAAHATHPLEVGLGRDISGRAVMLNLAEMPHLLIAGATGAGKSSCINSLVTSLLMRNTPDRVRLILVDPKRVELGAYNDVPHLLTPVVTNPKKAANALDWAVREMEMRYDQLAEVGVRDITGYNAAYDRGELPTPDEPDPTTGKGYERLPYIVVVVDELNDLMMVAARDVEASICRIAQMARAVGIHLMIATQRPSVDVITGVIKANIPSRLAFSVSSLADSRVILDQAGAEKLVGQGDMLMLSATSSRAQRIQGAWVDEDCVRKVAAHWKRQVARPWYVEGIAEETAGAGAGKTLDADDDELLSEAMELVVRSGLGSTSMLQRKLRVGFARAGRLMDLLERRGIVGPSEGSKARSVLMTVDELEAIQQSE